MDVSTSNTISLSRVAVKRPRKTRVTKKTTKDTKLTSTAKALKSSKTKIKTLDKPKVAKTKTKAKTSQAKKTAVKSPTPKTQTSRKKVSTKVVASITKPVSKTQIQTIKRHPLGHLLIEKMLREAGFRGGISSDKNVLERYSTDESIFSIKPQVVIQPKTKQDIEIATKVITRETKRFSSLSLTPRAAGTGLSGGSLTDSIVIDVCTHLDHIEEVKFSKDKIIISCEPGAMWRNVEKKLKKVGAYIPSYTSSKDICSIGGSIGNNAAGPDSLRYGHCAEWVEQLEVVLADGNTYTVKPLTLKQYKNLTKEKHLYASIAKQIFSLIEKNEQEILDNKPKTKKNSAGYGLWNVFSDSVSEFKAGNGTFDLTRIFSGSQGTIGVITRVTMRAIPIQRNTTLIVVPVFDLADSAELVTKTLKFNPINLEIFDGLTFDLALKNPDFFKKRLSVTDYYKVMLSMYTTYHIRYMRKIPEFTMLITLDEETTNKISTHEIISTIKTGKAKPRIVVNPVEEEMLWQIRRASYSLSKFQDPTKRPAAFLEDMTVPTQNLAKFFAEIKRLLKEFNVTSAVHGHGGNGHFHFYPLLDFTNKTTPKLIEKMSERFYDTAIKYKGNICGEHNDGIIRTPHLDKLFSKRMLEIFKQTENIFDPEDIFNPGKKVNPRFDIKSAIRTKN